MCAGGLAARALEKGLVSLRPGAQRAEGGRPPGGSPGHVSLRPCPHGAAGPAAWGADVVSWQGQCPHVRSLKPVLCDQGSVCCSQQLGREACSPLPHRSGRFRKGRTRPHRGGDVTAVRCFPGGAAPPLPGARAPLWLRPLFGAFSGSLSLGGPSPHWHLGPAACLCPLASRTVVGASGTDGRAAGRPRVAQVCRRPRTPV